MSVSWLVCLSVSQEEGVDIPAITVTPDDGVLRVSVSAADSFDAAGPVSISIGVSTTVASSRGVLVITTVAGRDVVACWLGLSLAVSAPCGLQLVLGLGDRVRSAVNAELVSTAVSTAGTAVLAGGA